MKLKPEFNTIYYSFTIDNENKALIIDFKNEWDDTIISKYMINLIEYIDKIDTHIYTLVLRCSEFKISIPELRGIVGPFLKVYHDAGFKHMRLITENPQKGFRKVVKNVGNDIGFDIEYCNSAYNKQMVY